MTSTITTAAELYQCDSQMRALIAVWDSERRCPMGLVDLLLENGMSTAAEAARWCATEPDKPVTAPLKHYGELSTNCGPYPTMSGKGLWIWHNGKLCIFASVVPESAVGEEIFDPKDQSYFRKHPSVKAAILWLLGNWRITQ